MATKAEKEMAIIASSPPQSNSLINCRSCGQERVMIAASVRRFDNFSVAIGWFATVAGCAGLVMTVVLVVLLFAPAGYFASAGNHSSAALALAWSSSFMTSAALLSALLAVVGSSVGALLTDNRMVYRCMNCGSCIDRA